MTAAVITGALRANKDTHVALKVLQQFIKSCHLPAGTVQKLVVAMFFRRFFFVTMIVVFLNEARERLPKIWFNIGIY